MGNTASDPLTSPVWTNTGRTVWGEGLTIWFTVEPLCCVLETSIKVCINYTSTKKDTKKPTMRYYLTPVRIGTF